MTNGILSKFIKLVILLLISTGLFGSDAEKEQRWSEQISDSLLVGDPIQLTAGDASFLGVYSEANKGPGDRAVILAHGMGVHPDWPDVIHPLRSELPDYGWATLSLQMPVLANEAVLEEYVPLFEEIAPRIQAALQYLGEQKINTVVLVGHSLGAAMLSHFLAQQAKPNVAGLVVIAMPSVDQYAPLNTVAQLEKINLPMLDLYGSRDREEILWPAEERAKLALKNGMQTYRAMVLEGADHNFQGLDNELVRTVRGWLKRHFPDPK
jgi:pimeloyl-ACP methyl ester carboxylesterase